MLKVATVFSGIGAIEHALKRANIEHEIIFACDNGDVDILSKKINSDIEEMLVEIAALKPIIKKVVNENKGQADKIEKLLLDLNNVDKLLAAKIKDLTKVDVSTVEICVKILTKISTEEIKKVRYKEFKSLLKKLTDSNEYKLFYAMLSSVKLLNEYTKENNINDLTLKSISSDGIIWDTVIEELLLLKVLQEEYNFKKIISEFKLIAEQLSMLHERINTLNIVNELEHLDNSADRKEYIDNLYSGKIKQNKVRESYLNNYDLDTKDFHWNVSFLEGEMYRGEVDLFVGGSPCQAFSLVGKQRGLDDTRGTLFYEFARLVKEIQPKVFIYENVKAVLSNDGGRTWEIMKAVFDELGYDYHDAVLNAKDYGIPQNRERVFVVGFRKDLALEQTYSKPIAKKLNKVMQDYLVENVSGKYYLPEKGTKFVTSEKNLSKRYTQIDGEIQLCQKKNQQFNWHGDFVFVKENDNVDKTVEDLGKYFLSDKVQKYVMSTGTKGFYSKPKTDLEVARPLLTTMHKMHRAGVDNYVTTEGRLRKLTPRECLRLMGFCDSFKINVSDTAMYQQAGNSIVVDVLLAILEEIFKAYPDLGREE